MGACVSSRSRYLFLMRRRSAATNHSRQTFPCSKTWQPEPLLASPCVQAQSRRKTSLGIPDPDRQATDCDFQEHTVMYPIDAIKVGFSRSPTSCARVNTDGSGQTRMQILNPNATTAYTGVLRSTYQIASCEGFFSLWRGMSSVIVGAGEQRRCHSGAPSADEATQALHTPSTLRRTRPSNTPWEATKSAFTTLSLPVRLCAVVTDSVANLSLWELTWGTMTATSGAAATIASDAFMNPFDGVRARPMPVCA